jgi:hypothetical protein
MLASVTRAALVAAALAQFPRAEPLRAPLTPQSCTLQADAPGRVLGCKLPVPHVTPDNPWMQHSGEARDPGERTQRAPILVDFGRVVSGVRLKSRGALQCSKDLGRIIAFRGGREVASAPNVLQSPEDCGDDNVTSGIRSGLRTDLEVDCIAIVGVDPWTFDVHGQHGRARLQYTLEYEVSGRPFPGGCAKVPDISTRWETTLLRFAARRLPETTPRQFDEVALRDSEVRH